MLLHYPEVYVCFQSRLICRLCAFMNENCLAKLHFFNWYQGTVSLSYLLPVVMSFLLHNADLL